jgi:hypothetical protein
MARLSVVGHRRGPAWRSLKPGDWFVREGEPACFFVIFQGQMRLVADVHGKPTEFASFDSNEGDCISLNSYRLIPM